MKVTTIFDRTLDVLFVVAGVLLSFASLSVGAMIFSRYFLNRPMGWMIEINEYILLHLAFLMAAWVLRKEAHVKMDIVYDNLGPKLQVGLNIFSSLLGAAVSLVLTCFGAKVTWQLYLKGSLTTTYLEVPKWPLTVVIFFGSFLLMVQFIRRTHGFCQAWRRLKDQGPSDGGELIPESGKRTVA